VASVKDNDGSFLPANRASPDAIYEHLRERILAGEIVAGSDLVQAQVAKEYGVSRGPVREAFRLLQREGLIEAHMNLRATVTGLSAQEAEHLYALRVVNECLALRMSIPLFTVDQLDTLERLVASVEESQDRGFGAWEEQHERFHALLLQPAGERLAEPLAQWADYTERYRRVYVTDDSGGWMLGAAEHRALAAACRERDATSGVGLLARHLSRAGLTLVATIDPLHEPRLLRAAVQQVTSGAMAE
jgi:DNA-binding GntR family transcriptional regulator